MDNKFITDVEIKKNKETVEVTVSIMSFDDYRCMEKVSLGLSEIHAIMLERKIKVGKCVQNPILQNKRRTTATWIFEAVRPLKKEVVKRPNTSSNKKRKNSTKLQKNLDNSEKRVIIEE